MYRTTAGSLTSLLPGLAAALLACVPVGALQGDWQELSCADPGFSIEAPGGWTVVPVAGRGARLVGPAGAPVVEVVVWPALRPPASAAQAAKEHEAVLARAMQYTPGDRQTIRTAAGDEAVVVSGLAQARGVTEASFFAAWGYQNMHWVVGTFCAPEELGELRRELLDRMIRSFRPGAQPPGPAVTTAPGPPGEPAQPPQPTAPGEPASVQPPSATSSAPVTVEPVVRDITPAPAEPTVDWPGGGERAQSNGRVMSDTSPLGPSVAVEDLPWQTVVGKGGYTVTLPVDWSVSDNGGTVVAVWNRDPTQRHAVVWWRVEGRGELSEAELRAMLRQLPQLGDLVVLGETWQREGARALRGSTAGGLSVVACYAWEADSGLLSATLAPAHELPELEGQLARIASSWRPSNGEGAAPERKVDFVGGLMSWQLPAGWQAQGGARVVDESVIVEVEAKVQGARPMRVVWRQPLRPAFRTLTALLETLGWREGEVFGEGAGASGLVVYRRRDPQRFLEDYLLTSETQPLTDVVVQPSETDGNIGGLLAGSDTRGQALLVRGSVSGVAQERLYLVATGSLPMPAIGTCWQAAELRAEAPAGHLAEAVAALSVMVNSARASYSGAQSAALQDLIARAQRALRAVPAELAGGAAAGKGNFSQWRLPAGALQYWSERAGTARN